MTGGRGRCHEHRGSLPMAVANSISPEQAPISGSGAAPASSAVGLGLALVSAASFSTSGTFARSLCDAGWTPGAAVAARIGCAAIVLVIPALVALRGRWHLLRRSFATIA